MHWHTLLKWAADCVATFGCVIGGLVCWEWLDHAHYRRSLRRHDRLERDDR